MATEKQMTAREKVEAAREWLFNENCPFWAILGMRSKSDGLPKFIEDVSGQRSLGTMATDGRHIYFNPRFVNKLTFLETVYVDGHEFGHDALGHPIRLRELIQRLAPKKVNLRIFNISADAVLYNMLNMASIGKEPANISKQVIQVARRFNNGESVEEIYFTLEKEEEEKKQQEKPEPDPEEKEEDQPEPEEKEEEPNNEDQKEEEEEEEGGSEDSEDEENKENEESEDSESSEGEGDEEEESDGEGSGEGEGDSEEEGEGEEESEEEGEGSGGGQSQNEGEEGDDPCELGGVIPAPEHGEELEEAKQDLVEDLRGALRACEKVGHMPGGLKEMLRDVIRPKTDGWAMLKEYVEMQAYVNWTYQKPNRQYVPYGLYMPTIGGRELGEMVAFIDNSGSISMEQAKRALGRLLNILEEYDSASFQAIFFADMASDPFEITCQEDIQKIPDRLDIGGGTDYRPPFQKVLEKGIDAKVILVFTDGFCSDFPSQWETPVIWVIDNKRGYDTFKPPFGEVILMEDQL